nr:DNA polymerase alpha catalytic subunit [Tanacetum cinerariifolium]
GTSPSMLADCLGLDPSKFQSKSSKVANNDHSGSVIGVADDEESYIRTIALKTSTDVQDQSPNTSFWNKLCCRKCQVEVLSVSVANQCHDETCDYTTLSLNLRVIGDSERGTACPNYPRCNGRHVRQYSEPNVHKQLSYFCYFLDANRFIDKDDHLCIHRLDLYLVFHPLTSFTHFCELRESQLLNGCPMACTMP